MISDLGTSVVLVPVIGVLGNVAIAKAFGECDRVANRLFSYGRFLNLPLTLLFAETLIFQIAAIIFYTIAF